MVTLQPLSRRVASMERDVGSGSASSKIDSFRGKLTGAVVVITGATWGLGSAIVRELGAGGALVVVGHSGGSDVAQSLASSARGAGAIGACTVEADVADQIEARTLIESTVQAYGRVDLLVNIAAITPASVTAKRDEAWGIDVMADLACCLFPMKAALPYFSAQSGGAIVNVNAFAASPDEFGRACYRVARRNLVTFTDQLAQKVSTDHVTANCISPGFSELSPGVRSPAPSRGAPATGFSVHDKVAHCVRYLCETGRQITGKTISIEGGRYS